MIHQNNLFISYLTLNRLSHTVDCHTFNSLVIGSQEHTQQITMQTDSFTFYRSFLKHF